MVRPRLTIYVCQESQQAREQQPKHENGDAAANTFFGRSTFVLVHVRVSFSAVHKVISVSHLTDEAEEMQDRMIDGWSSKEALSGTVSQSRSVIAL